MAHLTLFHRVVFLDGHGVRLAKVYGSRLFASSAYGFRWAFPVATVTPPTPRARIVASV